MSPAEVTRDTLGSGRFAPASEGGVVGLRTETLRFLSQIHQKDSFRVVSTLSLPQDGEAGFIQNTPTGNTLSLQRPCKHSRLGVVHLGHNEAECVTVCQWQGWVCS